MGSTSDKIPNNRGVQSTMDRFVINEEVDLELEVTELDRDRDNSKLSRNAQRELMYDAIGSFFYENGILFNAANSDSFVSMLRQIAKYGVGLKPPTGHDLSTTILDRAEKNTNEIVEEKKRSWM